MIYLGWLSASNLQLKCSQKSMATLYTLKKDNLYSSVVAAFKFRPPHLHVILHAHYVSSQISKAYLRIMGDARVCHETMGPGPMMTLNHTSRNMEALMEALAPLVTGSVLEPKSIESIET